MSEEREKLAEEIFNLQPPIGLNWSVVSDYHKGKCRKVADFILARESELHDKLLNEHADCVLKLQADLSLAEKELEQEKSAAHNYLHITELNKILGERGSTLSQYITDLEAQLNEGKINYCARTIEYDAVRAQLQAAQQQAGEAEEKLTKYSKIIHDSILILWDGLALHNCKHGISKDFKCADCITPTPPNDVERVGESTSDNSDMPLEAFEKPSGEQG